MSKRPKNISDVSNVFQLEKQLKNISSTIKKTDLLQQHAELSDFCILQAKEIERLKREISEGEHKIKHLEEILAKVAPIIETNTLKITDEEEIALIQLEKLKEIGRHRQFTVDEARIYDILVKNKRLSQENKPTIDVTSKRLEKMSPQELLKLADKGNKDD